MGARKNMPKGGYELVTELAKNGVSETNIAASLRLSPKTWRRIKREDPKAKEALEAGLQIEFDALIGKAYERAMDGNDTMLMFLLNNRHRKRMDELGLDGEREHGVRLIVELPKALSANQYQRLTKGATFEHEA